MPNRFLPVSQGSSFDQALPVINGNFSQLDGETYTKVYRDSSGVPNMIMGLLPDGTTGLVIAKEGVNVLTLFS
jgi:hypothetical protein